MTTQRTHLSMTLAGALVTGALAATARAADVHVPAEQATIQAGIDAAAPGDHVVLADGVYTGAGNRDVIVTKNVTIHSANGPGAVAIDCEDLGRAFHITAADATVTGLTITNGYTNGLGGAVLVEATGAMIDGCVFEDNTAEAVGGDGDVDPFTGNGGAIAFGIGAAGDVLDCSFTGNRATTNGGFIGVILGGTGGAIFVGSASTVSVTGCDFAGNSAASPGRVGNGFGGAIGTDLLDAGAATLSIAGSTFSGNSASIVGGALFLFGAHDVTIEDSQFEGNSAQSGGAVGFQTGLDLAVSGCDFMDNFTVDTIPFLFPGVQEQLGGGAIAGGGGTTLTVAASSFCQNTSLAGRGGAVSTFDGGVTTLTGCDFTGNTAPLDGGAVVSQQAPALEDFTMVTPTPSTTTMDGCVFTGNTTNGLGGAVADIEGSTLAVTGCNFDANVAESDPATADENGVNPFSGNGGAVAVGIGSTGDLFDCVFDGNTAVASGAGIGDILSGTGGAMFVGSASTVTAGGCSFSGNAAVSPGLVGNGFGGAVATDLLSAGPASLAIDDSMFSGNTASIAGGSLFLFGAHAVTVDGSDFDGNSAQSGGAIGFQNDMNLTVRDSHFAGNTAGVNITFLFPGVQEQIGGGAIGGGGALAPETAGCTLSLEGSSFTANASVAGRGGAVSTFGKCTSTIDRCDFRGNTAAQEGGAVVNHEAPALGALGPTFPSTMTMSNSLFACNTSGLVGGGVANLEAGTLSMVNCTLGHNSAQDGGGLANVDPGSTASVGNAILWQNDASGGPAGSEIFDAAGGVTVSYSIVRKGWPGVGNLRKNPKWVDAEGDDCPEGGDYRLRHNSSAINAGDDAAVIGATDLDGNERLVGPAVDMGAYELQPVTDDDDDDGDDWGGWSN